MPLARYPPSARSLVRYWGMLKVLGISEEELLRKARANPKVQKHVLDFIAAKDKAKYLFDLYDK